jgi:DAACS family dicarboxylate/amino acid:cation (Na+ or H+) symporter
MVDVFLNIIPLNPIDAMGKGNMLQVIFFAMLFGFGLSAVGERGKTVYAFFDGAAETMIKVTNMVMIYAPVGVFGLIAFTVSKHGADVLLPLIKVIGVMYIACLVHVLVCYLPLVRVSGITIGHFFKLLSAPLMIAFTTCSSAAALATNLIQCQKLGASKPVASFSLPLGNTINMDGTAVYMGVVAIFVAEIYGIPMPFDKQFQVLATGILASIGSVGVPGAGLIMSTIVFTQVGIPLEGIAIIAGIDRVMDMARTTMNVLGDATGAIVVSKWEGELDPEAGAKFAAEQESGPAA